MDFKSLVGQIFQESELYELLLFELEENYEQNQGKFIHLYFERCTEQKIKVTEIVCFRDDYEMDKLERQIIEKKEWIHMYQNVNHLNLLLVRLDRTGWSSAIWKDRTRTEDWCLAWADETPHKPLTPEEIQLGFMELAGIFEEQMELQKLRFKKAV